MKRFKHDIRQGWQKIVESQGMLYHTVDNVPYWDESAYYQFTPKEVDTLEAATNDLHALCLGAVQHIIDNKRYAELHIPELAIPLIEYSWNNETAAIYGRFDLQYDGTSPPKMLEYNADTPTGLLEAAVIQWFWMEDQFKGSDQFNSIHDRLIAKWKELRTYLKGALYLTYMDSWEDYMNVTYMQDTANQGGFETRPIPIEEIGWDSLDKKFIDSELRTIKSIFKLYPWEWLLKDQYGQNINTAIETTTWVEPPWKMLLSNKGILPILWELNPNHPNLLAAYFEPSKLPWHAKKPFYSREGANITLVTETEDLVSNDGNYGEEGFIYQDLALLPKFDENYPVIGSWVIDGVSAGMGIRESNSLITNNLSRFIPHIMKD
jgi:glutathionylspermidine synthase